MSQKLLLIGTALFMAGLSVVQAVDYPIEAKTADGETVNLYEDGTWRPKTLKVDHEIIRKDQFATATLESRLRTFDFSYDPKLWELGENHNEVSEMSFTYKGVADEAWCRIISERAQMTQDTLVSVVLQNFQAGVPDGKILQYSKAYVNGLRGDIVELEGTVDGFHVAFSTFATTGSRGTVQISCWTFQNLLDEYRPVFAKFYGGFFLK